MFLGPLVQVPLSIAFAHYTGTATLTGEPEDWAVHHEFQLTADDLAAVDQSEGVSAAELREYAADAGWEVIGIAGGGVHFTKDGNATGPAYNGIEVAATSRLLVERIHVVGPGGTVDLLIEPAQESEMSLRGPRGALHGTQPASDESATEAGGTESRTIEFGGDRRAEVLVDVVRPLWRGTPVAQLVGVTPTIVIAGTATLLISLFGALRTKALGVVVDSLLRWSGKGAVASGDQPTRPRRRRAR